MRQKKLNQMSIFYTMPGHKIAKELSGISLIIDDTPEVLDLVYDDLVRDRRTDTGRTGMTAEQVLRCTILKQYRNLTYDELSFHLDDSQAFRMFARMNPTQSFGGSTLQDNIKSVSVDTWESIHNIFVRHAVSANIEKGRKIRVDSTHVDTNIHHPLDSILLQDGVRIITRWLMEGKRLRPVPGYAYANHNRVIKKRVMKIRNSKSKKVKEEAYVDLIHYARRVRGYAVEAMGVLYAFESEHAEDVLKSQVLAEKLQRAVMILDRVIDQTERRVVHGEKVPASEKVVSFFEDHTDIIVKDNRDVHFGHKVFLSGGASGMILGCVLKRGNPADSDVFSSMVERHKDMFGRVPRQIAADGGFASTNNLLSAKKNGVKDVCFSKRRGISVTDMVKSNWVYRRLRNFRAGIEANISVLKRSYGLYRCNWHGWVGFQQYVWSSVVSYNLLVMSRHILASA
jgi:IS5 family transposase